MARINNRQLTKSIPEVNIIPTDSSQFESSIGAWVTYADAAGIQPVDGTGGSASITLSRTTVTSEVLNGSASLKLAKGATNRQGDGASLDLTVPNYLKGQPCRVAFSAKASANFDFGTPMSSADPSDVTVYLYDVTNSKLLQPFPYTIDSNLGYEGYFQIPSNCSSLRLILHVTTTNATAYDLFIDDVVLEEAPNQNVSTDSDWQDAGTITIGATTTAPTKGTIVNDNVRYKKSGDEWIVEYTYYQTSAGTAGSGDYLFSLPAGLRFDSSIPNFTSLVNAQITAEAARSLINTMGTINLNSSVGDGPIVTYKYSDTQFRVNALDYFTASGQMSGVPYYALSNAVVAFKFTIRFKGQGLTSSQVTAASANLNMPVSFLATQAVGQAVTANVTDITYGTVYKDTANGWSTNIYTVKVPGDYILSLTLSNTTGAFTPRFYKNGVAYSVATSVNTANYISNGICFMPDLKVGDTISVRSDASVTVQNGTLSINRLAPQSGIYKTRVAYVKDVKASGTGGGTATAGSYQTRTLNTIEGDASFISLASNQFTLQPGTYHIDAWIPCVGTNTVDPGLSKAKLRNVTDSTDAIIGTNGFNESSGAPATGALTGSYLTGVVTINAAKTFEIQQRVQTTASGAWGLAANFGESEIYTIVKIEKVL